MPLSEPTILALCGAAGSGKNTVGEIAQRLYPETCLFAIADKIREVALALDPWIVIPGVWFRRRKRVLRLHELVEEVGWDRAKREHPEVRRLLQHISVEAGTRVHGKNCWVSQLAPQLTDVWRREGVNRLAVITDIRLQHEPDYLRKLYLQSTEGPGGKLRARVHVWKIVGRADTMTEGTGNHETETQCVQHDLQVYNNHDLKWLEHSVGNYLKTLVL